MALGNLGSGWESRPGVVWWRKVWTCAAKYDERIVEGGNEGKPESLRKRIRILTEAEVHDPRDGTSW